MSRVSRSARPRGGATPRTPQVAASWPRPPRMRSAQQTPAPVTSVHCRGPGRGGTTDHTRCVDNTSDYPTLDNYVIQTVDVDCWPTAVIISVTIRKQVLYDDRGAVSD